MRRRIAALAALAFVAGAAPAAAHVQVTPSAVAPGDPVTFEILVPGEKSEAHTTEVALQVPRGVLPFAYEDQPGWRRTVQKAPDGTVDVVRWRGRLATDGFVRFAVLAGTPEREGDLVWKAVQRYSDGSEAAWIGAPGSENPAPVTRVTAAAAASNAGGEGGDTPAAAATPAPAAAAADDGDGGATVGIVLGAAGLVLGAVALVVALRRRERVPA